jgi:hypothetical protein
MKPRYATSTGIESIEGRTAYFLKEKALWGVDAVV